MCCADDFMIAYIKQKNDMFACVDGVSINPFHELRLTLTCDVQFMVHARNGIVAIDLLEIDWDLGALLGHLHSELSSLFSSIWRQNSHTIGIILMRCAKRIIGDPPNENSDDSRKRKRSSVRWSLFSFLRPRRCGCVCVCDSFDRNSIIIYVWRWPDMWMSKYNKHAACCRSYSSGAKCKHTFTPNAARSHISLGPIFYEVPSTLTTRCRLLVYTSQITVVVFLCSQQAVWASERGDRACISFASTRFFFFFCFLVYFESETKTSFARNEQQQPKSIERVNIHGRKSVRVSPGQTPPTNVLRNSTAWIDIYIFIW